MAIPGTFGIELKYICMHFFKSYREQFLLKLIIWQIKNVLNLQLNISNNTIKTDYNAGSD
jgi:hypothetical protein